MMHAMAVHALCSCGVCTFVPESTRQLLLLSVCVCNYKTSLDNKLCATQLETTVRFKKEHNLCFVIVLPSLMECKSFIFR